MAWINKLEALKIFEDAHTLDHNANAYREQIKAIPEETWMDDFQLVAVPTIPGPGKIYTNGACVIIAGETWEAIQEERRLKQWNENDALRDLEDIKRAFEDILFIINRRTPGASVYDKYRGRDPLGGIR